MKPYYPFAPGVLQRSARRTKKSPAPLRAVLLWLAALIASLGAAAIIAWAGAL